MKVHPLVSCWANLLNQFSRCFPPEKRGSTKPFTQEYCPLGWSFNYALYSFIYILPSPESPRDQTPLRYDALFLPFLLGMSPNKICNSKQMADVVERERERVPLRIQSWFHSEERKSVLRLWLFRVRHMLSVNGSVRVRVRGGK